MLWVWNEKTQKEFHSRKRRKRCKKFNAAYTKFSKIVLSSYIAWDNFRIKSGAPQIESSHYRTSLRLRPAFISRSVLEVTRQRGAGRRCAGWPRCQAEMPPGIPRKSPLLGIQIDTSRGPRPIEIFNWTSEINFDYLKGWERIIQNYIFFWKT